MNATTEWLKLSNAEFRGQAKRHGYAHLSNYTAEYCEWGEGPPLVLLPGLAGGYELLEPLVRLLAQQHRVISFQLRGEDNCFLLRRPFALTDLVDDVVEFLDWHCLESPPILGVSFGGVLALQLAARHPSRLQSLIVQGAGARMERGLLQQVASLVLSRYPLPVDSPFVNQFFNLFFGRRQQHDRLFHFVTRQCWQTDQSVMSHRFQMVEQFNLENELDQIRVPTLIVHGERDLLVSKRGLSQLEEGIANSRVVKLPGCGHLAAIMQPARVAKEVTKFLAPPC